MGIGPRPGGGGMGNAPGAAYPGCPPIPLGAARAARPRAARDLVDIGVVG